MGQKAAIERELGIGDFRRLVLDHIEALLKAMRENEELKSPNGFVKREPAPLLRRYRLNEIHQRVWALATGMKEDYPPAGHILDQTMALADRVLAVQTATQLLSVYTEVLSLHGHRYDGEGQDHGVFAMRANADRVYIAAAGAGDDRTAHPRKQ